MKMHTPLLIIISLLLFSCTLPPEYDYSQNISPDHFVEHTFDSRDWKVAYQAQGEDQIIIEWTVNNEPVEHWNELLTCQILFVESKYSAQQFTELVINQIGPNSTDFSKNVIMDTPDDVIVEWSHKGSGEWPGQHEVMRVFRGTDGIYRLAYTVKNSAYTQVQYNQWVENIKKATLRTN